MTEAGRENKALPQQRRGRHVRVDGILLDFGQEGHSARYL
jgi:hypothetical protein